MEEGNITSGVSGRQFLTPSKSFTKKRVTASDSIVGAIHLSPDASLARNKAGDFAECEGGDFAECEGIIGKCLCVAS